MNFCRPVHAVGAGGTNMARVKKKVDRNLDRSSWVAAARTTLIEKGISGISLRQLAEDLGATTGAFYWQFENLEELLEEVRKDWADRNTAPFTKAIESAGDDGWQQYLAYVRVVLEEDQYVPAYDNAIRDWAHSSPRTAEVLRQTEAFRIEQLRRIFVALGFEGRAASASGPMSPISRRQATMRCRLPNQGKNVC